MQIYQLPINELLNRFKTSEQGISSKEIKQRQQQYGINKLPEKKVDPLLLIFFQQFKSSLIYILLAADILIFIFGERFDGFIIGAILLFNAILGTIQEGRARNILKSLEHTIKTEAVVIREGKTLVIDPIEIVVGDIIEIKEGSRVPADGRLIVAHDLKVDEALLTGESSAIEKKAIDLKGEHPVADQINMVFKGTYILSGYGKAIVVAVGIKTQIGKIGGAIEEIETPLPLKKKLDTLSRWILIFVVIQTLILFIVGFLKNYSITELIVFLSALFICVIPEGLPIVLTLALVSGARNMVKNNVLVKRLQAVEGLGLSDVIIIDKTGTLTRNELVVHVVYAHNVYYQVSGQGYWQEGTVLKNGKTIDQANEKNIIALAQAGILLNKATISFNTQTQLFQIQGDPTDAALYIFGKKVGLDEEIINKEFKLLYEIPFDSALRLKISFFVHKNEVIVFAIGAPEALCKRSGCTENDDKALSDLLRQGYRIIAAGMRSYPRESIKENQPRDSYLKMVNDLQFLGFFAIQDAIRPDVEQSVEQARKAGLAIVMATGDHVQTALFVAKKVNIWKEGDEIIEGSEFDQLSDEDVLKKLHNITIFARVAPEQKVRIVRLYHALGNVVTMTGDGVNDVPSMMAADLSIAMGKIGTDVAKTAADMILLDDSFISIIAAIKEGRHIFFTLRRVTLYFFTTNGGEILIVFFALLFKMPLPLYPTQILWLNLVTDGFLDISLVAEPHGKNLLREKIYSTEQLIDFSILINIICMSVPMVVGTIAIFYYYLPDVMQARTMAFLVMALFQWFNVWNCRSENLSLTKIGLFTNKWLLLATSFVLFLQLIVIYVPFMQTIFKTVPLSGTQWLLAIIVSSSILLTEEIRKFIIRKYFK